MINRIKLLSIIILLSAGVQISYCQSVKDTAVLVKEFNKVMSFSVQPDLHYTTLTKIDAVPVMDKEDTSSMRGVFYKHGNNIYYSSGNQETCLEDSLAIQIDHERKMIWISRVDMETREKINSTPLGNKKLQDMFQKNYTISKSILSGGIARMNFQTKQEKGPAGITTEIGLEYSTENYLPLRMDMEMKMQQEADDATLVELKKEGIDESGLIQMVGDVKYVVRKQRVSISFSGIDTSPEKALQMPSWKDKLEYHPGGEFTGKGVYKEYEVIKTF